MSDRFFLGDTCAVLDIANVGNVAARLNEADIRTVDVWSETAGRTYPRKAVNESGLYDLIADAPQIRVTTKGLGEILRRLTEAVAS